MRLTLIALLFALTGCVSIGGIEEVGPNTYRIGVEATTDAGAAEIAKRAARDAAANFCARSGRHMSRSFSRTDSLLIRISDGSYSHGDTTLRFRCR